MTLAAYRDFLSRKSQLSTSSGFPCDPSEVNPILKPHQRAIVAWAVRGGRRALFESFGMGKTLQQLEIARLILEKSGGGRGLIVLPLGVRQEFIRDAAMLGTPVSFIRSIDEAGADGIYLTNYETVRDGKLDPREFTVLSLDEAGVLRRPRRRARAAMGPRMITMTDKPKVELNVKQFGLGVLVGIVGFELLLRILEWADLY